MIVGKRTSFEVRPQHALAPISQLNLDRIAGLRSQIKTLRALLKAIEASVRRQLKRGAEAPIGLPAHLLEIVQELKVRRKRVRRTQQVRVMMNPSEREAFVSLARRRNTDFSELTRQILYSCLRKHDPKQFAALVASSRHE